jgi:hypothetical protein
MRLIDADAEAKWCRNHVLDAAERSAMLEFLRNCSTIDAVPVVRCKDCRAMYTVGHGYRWCKVWERMLLMGEDGFCSYGERKDGEG